MSSSTRDADLQGSAWLALTNGRRGQIRAAAKKVFARNGFGATSIAPPPSCCSAAADAADFVVSFVMNGLRPSATSGAVTKL